MNKKSLSETDIRSKFITPALCRPGGAGWDLMTQLKEEAYFTKGRVMARDKMVKRGEARKADYLLYDKPNLPIAAIEAKDNNHSVGAGMQQTLEYAETLDLPFAYSSNGDAFLQLIELHVNAINLEKYVTGSAQAKMNSIPIALPPLAEQRRIVAKVDQLMALVDALEQQLTGSRATATNLLSALVAELTGSATATAIEANPLAAEDPVACTA